MEETFNWKRLLITIGVVLVTAASVGGSTYYVMGVQQKQQEEELQREIKELEQEKFQESVEAAEEETDNPISVQEKKGLIEGSLTYPGSRIPDDIVVYAENISTGKTYSSSQQLKSNKFKYGVGFSLEVPAGKYYVYGTKKDFHSKDGTEWKAYYNEFVVCGMAIQCKDYSKIVVEVGAGSTSNLITVGDWYPEK